MSPSAWAGTTSVVGVERERHPSRPGGAQASYPCTTTRSHAPAMRQSTGPPSVSITASSLAGELDGVVVLEQYRDPRCDVAVGRVGRARPRTASTEAYGVPHEAGGLHGHGLPVDVRPGRCHRRRRRRGQRRRRGRTAGRRARHVRARAVGGGVHDDLARRRRGSRSARRHAVDAADVQHGVEPQGGVDACRRPSRSRPYSYRQRVVRRLGRRRALAHLDVRPRPGTPVTVTPSGWPSTTSAPAGEVEDEGCRRLRPAGPSAGGGAGDRRRRPGRGRRGRASVAGGAASSVRWPGSTGRWCPGRSSSVSVVVGAGPGRLGGRVPWCGGWWSARCLLRAPWARAAALVASDARRQGGRGRPPVVRSSSRMTSPIPSPPRPRSGASPGPASRTLPDHRRVPGPGSRRVTSAR